MAAGEMGGSAEEKTRRRIAAIWEQSAPLVRERLDVLERAAKAAAHGRLREEDAVEAKGIAHKLAGSLGMFGFMEGTRVAREIEVMLDGGAAKGERMAKLVGELRGSLPLG